MQIPPGVLAGLVYDLLAHTITLDIDRAAEVLDEITAHDDPAALYGVCCAVAEAGRGALSALFDVGDAPVTWTCAGIADRFADRPHRLFAGRFLTAHANGDIEMALALYRAAESAGDDALGDSVCALLAHVAGLFRRAAVGLETP